MKKQKLLLFCSVFTLSAFVALIFGGGSAFAATKTWDGSSNNNFNTAANWNGDAIPQDGDDIVLPYDVIFDEGCDYDEDVTLNNDLSGVSFASLIVVDAPQEDCLASVIIEGNSLEVGGDVLGNTNERAYPIIELMTDLTITGEATIGAVQGDGLSIGNNDITLMTSYFSDGVSGSGDLDLGAYPGGGGAGGGCTSTIDGYPFAGDSSGYSGNVTILDDGNLRVSRQSGDMARHASSITKEEYGYLYFSLDSGQNMSLSTDITLKGNDVSVRQLSSYVDYQCEIPTSLKTVTLSGDITVTKDTLFDLYMANVKFTGSITGRSKIKLPSGKSGSIILDNGTVLTSALKTVTITSDDDCYDNRAFYPNNRSNINADCSDMPTNVAGILGGTGKIGAVTVLNGGAISPGNSPGILTTGNLEFEEGGIYDFEMAGTKAGDYDQIKVDGTVTLGNGTLNVDAIDGFTPKVGDKFTIINNNGSDAVSGRFDGLSQGAVFTDDGIQFRISYKGGSGNDVVLTVLSVVGAPDTGSATFTNNPLVILAITSVSSVAIILIARRLNKGATLA